MMVIFNRDWWFSASKKQVSDEINWIAWKLGRVSYFAIERAVKLVA
jgi:hypothetical protein